MGKVNNVVTVPASLKGKFFRYWVEFLKPLHKLTDREMDVVASFLRHRHELSSAINDPVILDKVTFSEDTRKKVREECGLSQIHLQVIMTKLKKSKVIIDGKINPKFIPKLEEGSNVCQLLFMFELQ